MGLRSGFREAPRMGVGSCIVAPGQRRARHCWAATCARRCARATPWRGQPPMTKPAATESAIRRSDSLSTSCSAAILLFLVTLAIWLLRVLVRLMLRNLHQGADAASRATMTQAYLALLAEGGPSRRPSRNRPSGAHSVNRTCTASSGFVHRNSLISGAVMPPPRCDRL